jgi:hypothetical protein
MTGADPLAGREVIFEFITLGDFVRVAAVDAATGVEVYVSGPAKTLRADLERIAARKLARKLGLIGGDGESSGDDDRDTKTPRRGGRGVIV